MLDYIFNLSTLWWAILFIYVPSCIGLIAVVLLQKGKGVGFAGAFGAGTGAETIFGPRSSRSLPQRITYTMAGLFMFLALVMSTLSGQIGKGYAPTLPAEEANTEGAAMDELFEGEKPSDRPALDSTAPGAEGPVQLPIMNQDPPQSGTIGSTGDSGAGAAPIDTPEASSDASTGGSPATPAAESGSSGLVPAETPLSVDVPAAPADATTAPAPAEAAAPAADAPAPVAPAVQ